MFIDRHIGMDETDGMGVDGGQFLRELFELDAMGKSSIQVWIQSPGGVITDGMSIYNAILKTKTKVDTYCIGMAASIAAVIFQAGRKRIMSDYGLLMFHNPSGGDKKSLDKFKSSILTMICERSGKAEDVISKMMDKTTWLTADEAIEAGLCDNIEHSSDSNKPRFSNTTDADLVWKESQVIFNNILKTQKENKMKKQMCIFLGLAVDTATDDEINKITDAEVETALQNKVSTDEANKVKAEEDKKKNEDDKKALKAELADLKKKMKVAEGEGDESDVKKLAKKCSDLEAKIKKMEEDEEDIKNMKASIKKLEEENMNLKKKMETEDSNKTKAEEDRKKAEAENYFKQTSVLAKVGTDEKAINVWKDKFVADSESVKSLIEAMPLNKAGVDVTKLVNKDADGKQIKPTNAITSLQELQAKRKTENEKL